MIKKNIYLFIALLLVSLSAMPQDKIHHEYSVTLGGGLSSLKYDPEVGKQEHGLGGNLGFGYTLFLNKNWGINSGVEFSYFTAKIKNVDVLSYAPGLIDSEGEVYDYYSSVTGYAERQHVVLANIPLMAHFQTEAFAENSFYISAGAKVGIPIVSKYKSDGDRFENKGWYPERENWATDQKFAGFGTFYDRDVKEDLDLKVAFMLSVETGIKWALDNGKSLYTGIYCDYGLNDITKNGHNNAFVTQEIQPDRYFFTNNSALESGYYTDYAHNGGQSKQIVDKVTPISLGIKLRLTIN